ncbi:MAG: pilus assembly FimT family protein [Candidatus Acidiferrales bacterium]
MNGNQQSVTAKRAGGRTAAGFSLIEIVLVLVISFILLAISIPMVQSSIRQYRYRNAVVAATMAIQATRFQAIRNGFPYAIEFAPATNTYQVSNLPPTAAAFANVGGPVPLESGLAVISQQTRLEFSPNGTVQATAGALNFALSYGSQTKTIAVSRVGRVSVQ